MSSIKANLGKIISNPPDMIPEACDGEAWSFKAYDDNDKLILEWNFNYIYDVDPLENIGRILDSYIPDYEEPV